MWRHIAHIFNLLVVDSRTRNWLLRDGNRDMLGTETHIIHMTHYEPSRYIHVHVVAISSLYRWIVRSFLNNLLSSWPGLNGKNTKYLPRVLDYTMHKPRVPQRAVVYYCTSMSSSELPVAA